MSIFTFSQNIPTEVEVTEEKKKGKSLFDLLNGIYMKRQKWDELEEVDKKTFSGYMAHRFISMIPQYLNIVATINLVNLTDEQVYKFYYSCLPKKSQYGKYIKSKAEKTDKDLINVISKHLEISTLEALDCIDLLKHIDPECKIVKTLLQKYAYDDKQIKKIIKTLKS